MKRKFMLIGGGDFIYIYPRRDYPESLVGHV